MQWIMWRREEDNYLTFSFTQKSTSDILKQNKKVSIKWIIEMILLFNHVVGVH